MSNITRINQETRNWLTSSSKEMKAALINHAEVGNGWTGRGRGCTPAVTLEYQCPTPSNDMDGWMQIVINREHCQTGIRRLKEIVAELFSEFELNGLFLVETPTNEDGFVTFIASFDLEAYCNAEAA